MRPPLNGVKTHSLSDHALSELKALLDKPHPRQSFNPGVANRLEREGLAETVRLPSPYAKHKGGLVDFLQITPAGLARLAEAA